MKQMVFSGAVWRSVRGYVPSGLRAELAKTYMDLHKEVKRVRLFVFFPFLARNWPSYIAAEFFQSKATFNVKMRNGLAVIVRPGTHDSDILKEIFFGRMYEASFELLDKKKAQNIIDIGAHVGCYTLSAAQRFPHAKFFTVEAMPENVAVLEENVAQNSLADRASVLSGAAAGEDGLARMYVMDNARTAQHSAFRRSSQYLEVPAFSLETLIAKSGFSTCDLVKIDIEGSEYDLLLNASQETLSKIRSIVMEYHPFVGKDARVLTDLLSAAGFFVYQRAKDRLLLATRTNSAELYRNASQEGYSLAATPGADGEETPHHCPLCNSTSIKRVEHMVHVASTGTYTLFHCNACGVEFWWPLKNPGSTWYEHDERYSDRNRDPIRDPNWNHKKIIAFLKPFVGKVLDVGCGVGNFLAWADKNGWKTFGIDFDRDAIDAGKKMFGLQNLFVADVNEFKAAHPNETFDLVTFFDVLEHVDNHNEFLDSIKSLLSEGGYVAMSMPYREHANWLMTGDWPPRHLTRWDRESLTKFLEERGFDVVYVTRRSEGLRYLILKMRFLFGKRLSFGLVSHVKKSVQNNSSSANRKDSLVKSAEWLAKTKDAILFGLPALVVWVVMLPSPKRYITLYAIARKRN